MPHARRFASRIALFWEYAQITFAFVIVLTFLKRIVYDGFYRKFSQLGAIVLTLTFYIISTLRTIDLGIKRHRLVKLFETIDSLLNHQPLILG
jgi:hypothetical protein